MKLDLLIKILRPKNRNKILPNNIVWINYRKPLDSFAEHVCQSLRFRPQYIIVIWLFEICLASKLTMVILLIKHMLSIKEAFSFFQLYCNPGKRKFDLDLGLINEKIMI